MNIIKRVYNWFTKLMPPRENQQAIINWQNWLNRAYPPGPWVALGGFYTITRMELGANNQVTFNANVGYPLKGFLNNATGEVKTFDARKFYVK